MALQAPSLSSTAAAGRGGRLVWAFVLPHMEGGKHDHCLFPGRKWGGACSRKPFARRNVDEDPRKHNTKKTEYTQQQEEQQQSTRAFSQSHQEYGTSGTQHIQGRGSPEPLRPIDQPACCHDMMGRGRGGKVGEGNVFLVSERF